MEGHPGAGAGAGFLARRVVRHRKRSSPSSLLCALQTCRGKAGLSSLRCGRAQASGAATHSTPALPPPGPAALGRPLSPPSCRGLGEPTLCVRTHCLFPPGRTTGSPRVSLSSPAWRRANAVSATRPGGQAQHLSVASTWFWVTRLHCPLTSHGEGTAPIQRSHSNLFPDALWADGKTGSPVGGYCHHPGRRGPGRSWAGGPAGREAGLHSGRAPGFSCQALPCGSHT